LDQILAAPAAQKRLLMNRLKRQLAAMDTQSRDAAIARLAQEHTAPVCADLLMQQQKAATYSWYEQEKSLRQTAVFHEAGHQAARLGAAFGTQNSGTQALDHTAGSGFAHEPNRTPAPSMSSTSHESGLPPMTDTVTAKGR
jgi:hypothetical protein